MTKQANTINALTVTDRRPKVNTGALWRALYSLPRSMFARAMGMSMEGQRDLYSVFGWDRMISVEQMYEMYHRGGIAHRVVQAYPTATWAQPPEVYMDTPTNDAWTRAWADLVKNTNLFDAVSRADILARLGRYAIILVGYDQPNLELPVRGTRKVLYFQPYGETTAKITKWVTDPTNPRFGLPEEYTIYPDLAGAEPRATTMTDAATSMPGRGSFRVHASRVVHVAEGVLEDEVFGTPMLGPIWNYLTDLHKVVGGSAESYWLTANRGMQVDIDKDAELSEDDAAALSEEVDEYSNQLRRVLRTRGVTVKDLGSKVADPRGPYTTIMQLLSGTTGIPQRILLGSEAGHLASTQDKGNWAEQVENNRALTAEPRILKPLLKNLINAGALPKPTRSVVANWPDAYRAGPGERAEISSKIALAANNMGLMFKNMTPPAPMQTIPGAPQRNPPGAPQRQPATPGGQGPRTQATADETGGNEVAKDASELKPLLSREEARAVLGFSTDNRVLEDTPLSESFSQRILLRYEDIQNPRV